MLKPKADRFNVGKVEMKKLGSFTRLEIRRGYGGVIYFILLRGVLDHPFSNVHSFIALGHSSEMN